MSYRATPPANEADTIDLSTSAETRYATVASLRPCVAATAASDGEGRASAVNGKLLEQRLLVPVQEVVAPFHELLQRGAARVGGRAVAQERRAALEDGDELREPEHVHPGGGELDRQRQPVHPPDDLRRERDGLGVRLEPGPCRPRTLEEELDGRRAERCDGNAHFAGDVERLAARRQDPHPGTLREERRRDPRCFLEDVLARVENDERAAHLEAAK